MRIQLEVRLRDLVDLKSATETFSVPIVAGEAHFDGISISRAGVSGELVFSTTLPLIGPTSCVSPPLSVEVGPATSLVVVDDVPLSVVAGQPFTTQPKVHVVDPGGNILSYDSSSVVHVYFGHNPHGGILMPADNTYVSVQNGVAQFKHLIVDVAGDGYFLCFELLTPVGIAEYNETGIGACGE